MKKITIVLVCMIVAIELILRFVFGFCDTVLFREDTDYEYIAQPNQNRYRFRKHINYNAHSMRSEEIDSTAVILLGLGDSVINGGGLTDQSELATTILSDSLSKLKGKQVQFLNVSAGSWGPDNCYAYIKKHGFFKAKEIWLFVSSHDAYDNMEFSGVVGKHPSYPKEQYSFALLELCDRYLMPRLEKKWKKSGKEVSREKELGINKKKIDSEFNQGFQKLYKLANEHKIPLHIYLHAEINELERRAYNEQGQKILEFAKNNNIPVLKDLEKDLKKEDFRDEIHLSPKGQLKLAKNVLESMTK